jgi:hypothetical protein
MYHTLATLGQELNILRAFQNRNIKVRYLPYLSYPVMIMIYLIQAIFLGEASTLTNVPNLPNYLNVKIFEFMAAHP